MSYRDEARRALESSAAREVQNEFLSRAKQRHEALRQFTSVDKLLGFLQPSTSKDAKDAVLLALVQEHQRGEGQAFALIAVAMFQKLEHLYITRAQGDEPDDLWGRIVGAFVEALDTYPVARRPSKVAANIEGETMAALRKARLRERRATEAKALLFEAIEPFLDDVQTIDVNGQATVSVGDFVGTGEEAAIPPDATELLHAEQALDRYLEAEVIDVEERFLLLGVHLYEKTLGELARELGISREAAKKRHQRALARVRKAGRSGKTGGSEK